MEFAVESYSLSYSYYVVLNCLYLASFEAKEVTEVDGELQLLFKEHYQDLVFFYSPIDPYTPLHFVEDLKKMIPDGLQL